MANKLFFSIVFIMLGSLFAAGYCSIGQAFWQHHVSYTPPAGENLSREEWGERLTTTKKHIKSGLYGHRITFLGMLIEEIRSWGNLRPEEYEGIPGGTTTFILLGGVVGLMLYWAIVSFRYAKPSSKASSAPAELAPHSYTSPCPSGHG